MCDSGCVMCGHGCGRGVGGWGEHGCVVGKEGNVGILDFFFLLILILLDVIGFELNLNAFMGVRLNMRP